MTKYTLSSDSVLKLFLIFLCTCECFITPTVYFLYAATVLMGSWGDLFDSTSRLIMICLPEEMQTMMFTDKLVVFALNFPSRIFVKFIGWCCWPCFVKILIFFSPLEFCYVLIVIIWLTLFNIIILFYFGCRTYFLLTLFFTYNTLK